MVLVKTPALPVRDALLSTGGKLASAAQLHPPPHPQLLCSELTQPGTLCHATLPHPRPHTPGTASSAQQGLPWGCRMETPQVHQTVHLLLSEALLSWCHRAAFGAGPGWPADFLVPALPSSFVLGQVSHFISSSQQSRPFPGRLAPGSCWMDFSWHPLSSCEEWRATSATGASGSSLGSWLQDCH